MYTLIWAISTLIVGFLIGMFSAICESEKRKEQEEREKQVRAEAREYEALKNDVAEMKRELQMAPYFGHASMFGLSVLTSERLDSLDKAIKSKKGRK